MKASEFSEARIVFVLKRADARCDGFGGAECFVFCALATRPCPNDLSKTVENLGFAL